MRLIFRACILLHRYLGIGLCLLVVVWFASGIVMVFANDMPRVTAGMRLTSLAPIDFSRVRLSLSDALVYADLSAAPVPARLALTTVIDRPVYRLGDRTVYADSGERLRHINPSEAQAVAARVAGVAEARTRAAGALREPDQWTMTQRRALPLHKVIVDDAQRTVVYVSEYTGEVAMVTTRRSRLLAMAGAIPHWLYLAPLRVHSAAWRQVVIWTSGLTCLLAVSGLLVGLVRMSCAAIRRGALSPYAGWMKWHHVMGLLFGALTLTWAFSGLLSMEPWGWASDDGEIDARISRALSGEQLNPSRFPAFDAAGWHSGRVGAGPLKEVEFAWIQDAPYYILRAGTGADTIVDAETLAARRAPFPLESFLLRVSQALPGIAITDTRLLDSYDSYYYAQDMPPVTGARPLPVVRLTLADESSIYIDPATSRLMGRVTARDRVERWLYNGLHSLDFSFWYHRPAVWRAGVTTLLSGGLVLGLVGAVIALKRLRPRNA